MPRVSLQTSAPRLRTSTRAGFRSEDVCQQTLSVVLGFVSSMMFYGMWLALLSFATDVWGQGLVATGLLRVDLSRYLERAEFGLDELDLWTGLLKATVFGLTIAIVACSQGLQAKRGAAGVGAATMTSVVVSFVLILIFDYIITWMFY